MGEGGVIPQSFKVDEFDQDIRILFRFRIGCNLCSHKYHFLPDDVFLSGFILGFSNEFDKCPSLFAESLRCFFVLKEVIH